MFKYILEARSLVKRHDGRSILDGIHLHIEQGNSVSFLSEKRDDIQSLMYVLSTLEPLSAGDLYLLGLNTKFDLKRVKKNLGVVIDCFDNELSLYQNLDFHARFFELNSNQKSKIIELLRAYDLEEDSHKIPITLSFFDRLKAALIRAIITEPKVSFMMDDFARLNNEETDVILELISELSLKSTFLFFTQSPTWAMKLSTKIGVLSEGKIKDFGSPHSLISEVIGHEVIEFSYKEEEVDYFIGRIKKDHDYYLLRDKLYLFLKPGQDSKYILDMINSDEIIIRKPDIKDLLIRRMSETSEGRLHV